MTRKRFSEEAALDLLRQIDLDLAQEGRHQASSNLSRQSLGKRLQWTLQWNAPARSPECWMVLNPQAGAGCHQQMAQTV